MEEAKALGIVMNRKYLIIFALLSLISLMFYIDAVNRQGKEIGQPVSVDNRIWTIFTWIFIGYSSITFLLEYRKKKV